MVVIGGVDSGDSVVESGIKLYNLGFTNTSMLREPLAMVVSLGSLSLLPMLYLSSKSSFRIGLNKAPDVLPLFILLRLKIVLMVP